MVLAAEFGKKRWSVMANEGLTMTFQTVFDRSNREIPALIAREREAGRLRPFSVQFAWLNRAEFAELVRRLPVPHPQMRRDWLEGLRLFDLLTCGDLPQLAWGVTHEPCGELGPCPLRPAVDWVRRSGGATHEHRLLQVRAFLAIETRDPLITSIQEVLLDVLKD